jgi:hypothetical protein
MIRTRVRVKEDMIGAKMARNPGVRGKHGNAADLDPVESGTFRPSGSGSRTGSELLEISGSRTGSELLFRNITW